MNQKHLAQLWKWLSLGAFVYVVGSVITIQGGVDIFGVKFLANPEKDGTAVVAYFAVIVGSDLLGMATIVAILHARRHGGSWHDRIPVVMLDGLDTGTWEGRLFQVIVVVVLVLTPLYGIGRSIIVANEGAICEQPAANEPWIYYPGGQWALVALPPAKHQLRLMTRDTVPGPCNGGVEVNWYTPVLFAGLPIIACLLLVGWVAALIMKQDV